MGVRRGGRKMKKEMNEILVDMWADAERLFKVVNTMLIKETVSSDNLESVSYLIDKINNRLNKLKNMIGDGSGGEINV
jgi:hypothetical protein